jgi:4-amino-4-deoxy-L-arabinose transferase-like glycosyltransferase
MHAMGETPPFPKLSPAVFFRGRLPRPSLAVAFAIVLLLGGLLRFATLSARGFWGDELSTVFLAHHSFGGMLHSVGRLESTPPLYYALAWVWGKAFGTTETGIRSLSALLGLATVPMVYAAGRQLVSRRAALVAATLVAVNPLLVWYSQEARSYALLALLAAAGVFFFARALRGARGLDLAGWAVVSSLALATHYFAAFLILAEAIALARAGRWRPSLVAAFVPVGLTGALLLPLLLQQRSLAHATWISHTPVAARLAAVPAQFTVGFDAPLPVVLGTAGALLALVGAVATVRRATGRDRHGAKVAAVLSLIAIAVPLCLALGDLDYLNGRNLLATLVPAILIPAVGYATPGARAARVAGGLIVALSLAVVLATAWQPKFRSEDWRAAAEDLSPLVGSRALVAAPGQAGRKPLEYYVGAKPAWPSTDLTVREVVVVALPRQGDSSVPRRQLSRLINLALPGFRLARSHLESDFALLTFRAPRAVHVAAGTLARDVGWGRPAVLAETR